MKKKLLISSCLIGKNVKYNGSSNKLDDETLSSLEENFILIDFCPEVEGGLPTPRTPCEIISQNPLKIINKKGIDKTKEFTQGAKLTLDLCKKQDISISLLKANSPSCSSKYIYDGTFSSKKIEGLGITAQLLKNNNITLYDEINIDKLFTDNVNN